jgi:D-serine deaminase-like pyridoxal phosphate-dependent protein
VLVGESKARRLAALAHGARVGACVDSVLQVEQLGAAARDAGTNVGVLIEVDVGQGRCGVGGADEALVLAERIASFAPWLELRGLQAYHGRAQHLRSPQERSDAIAAAAAIAAGVRDALRARGYACDEVCGGGTGSYPNEIASGVYTELQAGSYVLMDGDYQDNQPDPRAPALRQVISVWCTVVTERATHLVLDGGLKAFAVDSGRPRPAPPGWAVRSMSDEHTVLVPSGQASPLHLADKLALVPGHCDPTVNLHDWFVAHRGGRVEAVWPIDARGALF